MVGISTAVLLLHHFRFEIQKNYCAYFWWTKFTIHDQLAVWSLNFHTSLRAYKRGNTIPSPQIQPKISRYSLNQPLTYIIFWVFLLVWVRVDVHKYGVFSSTRNSFASSSLHSDGWRHTLWKTVTRVARKRGTPRRRGDDIYLFIATDDIPRSFVPSSALKDSV